MDQAEIIAQLHKLRDLLAKRDDLLVKCVQSGLSVAAVARESGVSRQTITRALERHGQ